jgi:hypothetical protein
VQRQTIISPSKEEVKAFLEQHASPLPPPPPDVLIAHYIKIFIATRSLLDDLGACASFLGRSKTFFSIAAIPVLGVGLVFLGESSRGLKVTI